MQVWLNRIRQQFFSNRQYRQSVEDVTVMETAGRPPRWVLSRKLCRFSFLDFSSVPASKRQSALQNKLIGLSPFRSFGYWAMWDGGFVSVWFFNDEVVSRQQQNREAQGERLDGVEVVPESVYGQKVDHGSVLVRGMDGYLGQHWVDGHLVQETFWDNLPAEHQWHQFVRGCGEELTAVPEPGQLDYRAYPWTSGVISSESLKRWEFRVTIGVFVVLAILLCYQLTGTIRLGLNIQLATNEISGAQSWMAEVRALRDEAFELHGRNLELAEVTRASQVRYMTRLGEVLPDDTRFVHWQYQPGALGVTIGNPSVDLPEYVSRVESAAEFSGVTLEPLVQGSQLRISIELNE